MMMIDDTDGRALFLIPEVLLEVVKRFRGEKRR